VKKPKRVRRKARFRVGEVVFHKSHKRYYKIFRVEFFQGMPLYYLSDRTWSHGESEFRPLTAKEIGPRRERGQ
jgi:hypothetical protein